MEEQTIKRLVVGPSSQVISWQGYDINVYLFYTAAKDKKTISQREQTKVLLTMASQMIYRKCTIVTIYKFQYFGVVGSNTLEVLRWMPMDSRLLTSIMLVTKMTHGYLLHKSQKYYM